MSLAVRLQVEPVRYLAAATIAAAGGAFVGIGTAMTNPIRMFMLQNLTDAAVMFSLDGINSNFPLPANGYMLLDITSNKTLTTGFFLAEGQRVYASTLSTPPTTGFVYLSVFYGADV